MNARIPPRAAAALTFFLIAALAAGCGGKANPKGKVTYQGKPVVWGSVTLVDSTGMYHQGEIDLQGNYSIDGVPTGPVKIGVHSPKPEDPGGRGGKGGKGAPIGGVAGKGAADIEDPREKFFASQGGKKNVEPEKPRPPAGAWFPIPEKFSDPQTSGLTGDVKSGTPLDIDLK